ncbi:MAG: TIR domain-containing protein, partial [Phenylobacterium sp.]
MSNVFISYPRSEEHFARRTADALRAAGHEVWTDADLPPHRAYSEVIEERLKAADAVIVLWSVAAEKSQWVRAEAEFAREHGKLVQIVVDDSLPPMPFNQTQCARLKGWNGDRRNAQWRKVLESLGELSPARDTVDAAVQVAPAPDRGTATAGGSRRRWSLALAAGLILAVAGGAWLTLDLRQRRLGLDDPRTVVLPFKALSTDRAAQDFAALAESDLAGRLSESQFRILAPSHARDADLTISGAVRGEGDQIHVRASLNDPRAGATLWSAEFKRSAADAASLRSEVGWRLNDVMASAVAGRRSSRGRLGSAELGLFIRAQDALAVSLVESRSLAEELTRRAPNFAPGHAMMCMQIVSAASRAAPMDFAAERDLGLAECHRAIELDPRLGSPRRGISYVEDGRHWARREMLLKPVGVKDLDPDLGATLGELMAAAGRQDEGIALLQGAAAARKGWTIFSGDLATALMQTDRTDETREFIANRLALRPTDRTLQKIDFVFAALRGAPDDALSRLQDPARRPADLSPPEIRAYGAFIQARRTHWEADREAAVAAVLDSIGSISRMRPRAVSMLAALGDRDDAFRLA